jgi:hypothetical protein
MAQRLRLNRGEADGHTLKEDSAVEKQKRLDEKNKQGGPQQKRGQDHLGPNKPPKVHSQKLPGRPGERSDEESIGRPVQLDKDQHEPRPPGESHREDRPRTEPAGTA